MKKEVEQSKAVNIKIHAIHQGRRNNLKSGEGAKYNRAHAKTIVMADNNRLTLFDFILIESLDYNIIQCLILHREFGQTNDYAGRKLLHSLQKNWGGEHL